MNTLGFMHPVFLLFALSIAVEAWIIARSRRAVFPWKESAVSLFIALGGRVANFLAAIPIWYVATWIYDNRLATFLLKRWWEWVVLFLCFEFLYYWHHRLEHTCRWLWATHRVHHSPEHLTFSGAYRLGWTSFISGIFLFFMPLVWLGFTPLVVFEMYTASLVFQFWLHTDLIPKLGPFDLFLNTPSNHRVHHAINSEYINANYGAALIIFDRLFGTYVSERNDLPCRYGIVGGKVSHNPFMVLFCEWFEIAHDLFVTPSLRGKLMAAFGPPGGSQDALLFDAKNSKPVSL